MVFKWVITGMAVYLLGFAAVLWMSVVAMPGTFGLVLWRALLWPLFLFFGIPRGRRLPMD